MSFQITTAFVEQFTGDVDILLQQEGSRLRQCIDIAPVRAKTRFFEQLGDFKAQRVTERHGNSPIANVEHARRTVSPIEFEVGEMIDKNDDLKTVASLDSPYKKMIRLQPWPQDGRDHFRRGARRPARPALE